MHLLAIHFWPLHLMQVCAYIEDDFVYSSEEQDEGRVSTGTDSDISEKNDGTKCDVEWTQEEVGKKLTH